jgi:deoxyribose-phosphate aldolase
MDLSQLIDHTILDTLTSPDEIKKHVYEAIHHAFAGVCIPAYYVGEARQMLGSSPVKLVTIAGFPLGHSNVSSKIESIKKAIEDGADEADAVLNHCAVKAQHWNYVKNEIESLTTICHMKGKALKLFLEADKLTREELKKLCSLSAEAEVDFVIIPANYDMEASLELQRKVRGLLPSEIKIKVSGAIRDRNFASALEDAGADRIGTASAMSLILD